QRDVGGRLQTLLAARAEALDDGPLALADLREVQAHVADVHAVVGAAAGQVGDAGAGHHRLGGGAAVVDAGAADELAFDQGGLPAGLRQRQAERLARLPAADDDRVELLGGGSAHRDSFNSVPLRVPLACAAPSTSTARDPLVALVCWPER